MASIAFVRTSAEWAKPKSLSQTERENKSVYSRNVLSFFCLHEVIFFAKTKSDISLAGSYIARARLAVIFYSPLTCVANITRRKPNNTAQQYNSPQANRVACSPLRITR